MITFAFSHWNEKYKWWHPNSVPLDFIVDGKKEFPITLQRNWFKTSEINNLEWAGNEEKIWEIPCMTNEHRLSIPKESQLKLLKDIPLGEKYLYPILLGNYTYFVKNNCKFKYIDKRVIEGVKKGLAKIVLLQEYEGWSNNLKPSANNNTNKTDFECLHEWCCEYNFKKNDVYYIHGNLLGEKQATNFNFSYISVSVFPTWLTTKNNEPYEYFPFNSEQNLFLCYNRRFSSERLIIVCELIKEGLFNRGLVSFNSFPQSLPWMNPGETCTSYIEYTCKRPDLVEAGTFLDGIVPLRIDMKSMAENPVKELVKAHHENTFLTIINETRPHEDGVLFFSEKIWKAMLAGQPFLLLNQPYALKKLKEMGYQTFDKWFDESYDEELNLHKRIKKIVSVVKKYSEYSPQQLMSIRNEMYPILKHNLELFNNIRKENGEWQVMLKTYKKIWKELNE